MSRIAWLREADFVPGDSPALRAAAEESLHGGDGRVVALVVVDGDQWAALNESERSRRLALWRALDRRLADQLLFQHGKALTCVPRVAAAAAADAVYVTSGLPDPVRDRELEQVAAVLRVPVLTHGPARDDEELPPTARWWMPLTCDGYPSAT